MATIPPHLTQEARYKSDQRVGRYGIRPAYRKAVKRFGASIMLPALGFRRKERVWILNWFAKRFVWDFYCQFSLAGGHDQVSPVAKIIEITDHILERGGTVTFALFNFTDPVLEALAPAQRTAVLASIIATQQEAKSPGMGKKYAAKVALMNGWNSEDLKVLKFAEEHIRTRLAPLAKYRGDPRVRFRLQTEIMTWEPVSPEKNVQTCQVCGWKQTTDPAALDRVLTGLEDMVETLGFTVLRDPVVHAYFNYFQHKIQETGEVVELISQWYLEYPETVDGKVPKFLVLEANAISPEELLRMILDLADRGAEEIFLHSPIIGYQGAVRADSYKVYEQFKGAATARSWVPGIDMGFEGVCVLDPAMDHAATLAAEVVTLGRQGPLPVALPPPAVD